MGVLGTQKTSETELLLEPGDGIVIRLIERCLHTGIFGGWTSSKAMHRACR